MPHVINCTAVGCQVKSKTHPSIKCFRFPQNEKRLKIWKEVAEITSDIKSGYLCEWHFPEEMFYSRQYRHKLVRNAVPKFKTGPFNEKTRNYCPIENFDEPSCSYTLTPELTPIPIQPIIQVICAPEITVPFNSV